MGAVLRRSDRRQRCLPFEAVNWLQMGRVPFPAVSGPKSSVDLMGLAGTP